MKKTVRTLLVTVARNEATGETKQIYGRYDAVALNNQGFQPVKTYKAKYEMTDAEFVRHGRLKHMKGE